MTSGLTFDAPPLSEVVIGRRFLRRPDFLLPYFGAYWETIRAKFPRVSHAAPLIDAATQDGDVLLLPRVWFHSSDETRLIQLQQDRFHYNWKQTRDNNEYVRFPRIQGEFLEHWENLERLVEELTKEPIQPSVAELTYVNIIEVEGAKSSVDVAKTTLRDFLWSSESRFLADPGVFASNLSFRIPDGSDVLNVTAASANRKKDQAPLLRFELTVTGKCTDASFAEWSDRAHDFLVEAFRDLTTSTMHIHWKLRET